MLALTPVAAAVRIGGHLLGRIVIAVFFPNLGVEAMHCRQKAPARRIGERPLPQLAHALGVPDERIAPAIAEVPYILTFEGHSILPELAACMGNGTRDVHRPVR